MKHISHSFFRGFRRLSVRSGSGSGPGRCFSVFPKVDTPLWTSPDGLEGSSAFGARVQKVQRVQRVKVGASKL